MVIDLLDLAKVEAGKVGLKYSEVRAGDALRGLLRPLSASDIVSLVFSLRLTTDVGKLAQILRNLVSNALKFTEAGEVRISMDCAPGAVVFRVTDTGIGIAPANQARIFEEFAQVDNLLQRKVRGTGLGLPLSRKLADLQGGSLNVESAVGVGSTFTLTSLQVDSPPPAEPPAEALPPPIESVLIIDDSERDRYLVRQIFRGAPFRIIEAANGSEGTGSAGFEQPRLIVLDLPSSCQA
jgi:K+-sensing histidine kinase KdpD